MKIEDKGHTRIIRDTNGDAAALLQELLAGYQDHLSWNLILDLRADKSLSAKSLSQFSKLARQHKKNHRSLVIVSPDVDFSAVPSSISAVPTLQEAHDLIEMEEIERDLGF